MITSHNIALIQDIHFEGYCLYLAWDDDDIFVHQTEGEESLNGISTTSKNARKVHQIS